MTTHALSFRKELVYDVVIALCLLAVGLLILKLPVAKLPETATAEESKQREAVFRGVSVQERAAEQQPADAAIEVPAPAKPDQGPPQLSDPGGASRSGAVIELVYGDPGSLLREAVEYGFVVRRRDEPAPARSVGSIDCPGFRLYFDRALLHRIDKEIGPLAGLPDGTLVSVALEDGRLRKLS